MIYGWTVLLHKYPIDSQKRILRKHLANVINNIANYSRENYPYPGYLDIVDTPNKVAIIVATNYINYVISLRVPGSDIDIHR